jgi:hypothetical protein
MSEADKDQDQPRVGPLQTISSVFAAAFGVQSSKNRERDFQQGRFANFAIAGILFTILLVGTLYLVVSTVLENAR